MRRIPIAFFALLAIPILALAGPNYNLNWYVVDGGGDNAVASASFKLGMSAAQPVAGEVSSASYRMKMGFWYGAHTCHCLHQGDVTGDGLIDVFDVIGVIGIAFSGEPDPQDPACPKTRGDVDNNGVTDVFDVIYLIATAFSGGSNPINPCGA